MATLINTLWFSRHPCSGNIIYDNGSEFKLNFQDLCKPYGLKLKSKPTIAKNPKVNTILEHMHQVVDMNDTVTEEHISNFIADASWAIRSTYHTVINRHRGKQFSHALSKLIVFTLHT